MDKKLNWNEFDPSSHSDWEQAAEKMLKGKDPGEWLIWKTIAGTTVPSYADRETYSNKPGKLESNQTSKLRFSANDWLIAESFSGNPKNMNAAILEALAEGVNSLHLDTGKLENSDLKEVLKEVLVEVIDIKIHSDKPLDHFNAFINLCEDRKIAMNQINGGILVDAFEENEAEFHEDRIQDLATIIEKSEESYMSIKSVLIDTTYATERGAGIELESALALAKAHEYLLLLAKKGIKPEVIDRHMVFKTAFGLDYLAELSRLRRIKGLWTGVLSEYCTEKKPTESEVHVENAGLYQSVNDAHNNLLRSTLGAMAAAIAGVDSILLNPFDLKLQEKRKLSKRWSRNIQFILKDEAFLAGVKDPAGGSWFIEILGDTLASEIWKLFKEIENRGGYRKAMEEGCIDEMIDKDAKRLKDLLSDGNRDWIGVNIYPPEKTVKAGSFKKQGKLSDLEDSLIAQNKREE